MHEFKFTNISKIRPVVENLKLDSESAQKIVIKTSLFSVIDKDFKSLMRFICLQMIAYFLLHYLQHVKMELLELRNSI